MAKPIFTQPHRSFPGRLNFAFIAQPGAAKKKDGTSNPPKYSCSLIQKVNPHTEQFIVEINKIGLEAFGDKWNTSDVARRPYKRGEQILEEYAAKLQAAGEGKEVSEQMKSLYTGKVELKASGRADKPAPQCFVAIPGGKNANELIRRPGVAEDIKLIEDKFYNGCYCCIAVTGMTYYQSAVSWGVTLILKGIKFMSDGDRLGSIDLGEAFSQEDFSEETYMDEMETFAEEGPATAENI